MFDCKMIINKMNIEKNKLNLSVSISCPFDIDVTSPKAKIIFECNGKTRRLPFLVTNYFRQKQSDSCIIVCTYSFFLDEIYYNYNCNDDIKVRIDFYYGDNEVIIPFTVSTNVLTENSNIELDEKYIEYECFDGVTVFSDESEFDNDRKKSKNSYSFDFDCENNQFIIHQIPENKYNENFIKKSVVIIPLIRFIFFILRIVLSVVLLPYFIIDGFLAALDILPRRKTQSIDSLAKNIFVQIKVNVSSFMKTSFKRDLFFENIRRPIYELARIYYKFLSKKPIVKNQIAFMSGRRDEIGGNPEYVYNLIKDRKDIEFKFLMFSDPAGHRRIKNVIKFLKLYATSKVVIVDDYFRLLNLVTKREDVKLFQLWHACGAFKTFGFTRLGKKAVQSKPTLTTECMTMQ